MLNGGIILGALFGYMASGEFRITLPWQKKQYTQVIIGGILMGYGAGLASGCSVGAFFSAIPSLGLNGIVFGAAMAAGAWAGVKLITRLG